MSATPTISPRAANPAVPPETARNCPAIVPRGAVTFSLLIAASTRADGHEPVICSKTALERTPGIRPFITRRISLSATATTMAAIVATIIRGWIAIATPHIAPKAVQRSRAASNPAARTTAVRSVSGHPIRELTDKDGWSAVATHNPTHTHGGADKARASEPASQTQTPARTALNTKAAVCNASPSSHPKGMSSAP